MTFLAKKGLLLTVLLFFTTSGIAGTKTEDYIRTHSRTSSSQAKRIATAIHSQANKQHIPVSLLVGVMQEESSFKPTARSKQGAMGLMQVMPRLHCRRIRRCNLFSIPTAVSLGTRVLHDCKKHAAKRRDTLRCYTGYKKRRLARYVQRVESHMADYQKFAVSPLSLND
jgi:hypothetical protein